MKANKYLTIVLIFGMVSLNTQVHSHVQTMTDKQRQALNRFYSAREKRIEPVSMIMAGGLAKGFKKLFNLETFISTALLAASLYFCKKYVEKEMVGEYEQKCKKLEKRVSKLKSASEEHFLKDGVLIHNGEKLERKLNGAFLTFWRRGRIGAEKNMKNLLEKLRNEETRIMIDLLLYIDNERKELKKIEKVVGNIYPKMNKAFEKFYKSFGLSAQRIDAKATTQNRGCTTNLRECRKAVATLYERVQSLPDGQDEELKKQLQELVDLLKADLEHFEYPVLAPTVLSRRYSSAPDVSFDLSQLSDFSDQ